MNTVKIGSQEWATEDLKVTKFRNGEDIPLVTDNEEWSQLTTAAYCITPEGNYLYNWYAVNDARELAPEGFHVPSDKEWTELTSFLGGEEVAGKKIKTAAWGGDNSSGFSALPAGYRGSYGYFSNLGDDGLWWSSSPLGGFAIARGLYSGYSDVGRSDYDPQSGFSVRCLKNL